jgi:hypothetical protein
MTVKEIIELPIFFNVFIKDQIFFNSLKDKFPDLLADLVSSKDNPTCSCRNRVKAYLIAKINTEEDFFIKLLSEENIKNIYRRKGDIMKKRLGLE